MSVNRYNATTDTMEHIAGNEAINLHWSTGETISCISTFQQTYKKEG